MFTYSLLYDCNIFVITYVNHYHSNTTGFINLIALLVALFVDELVFMLSRCSESLALCSFAVCLVFEMNILYFMVGLIGFPKYIKKNILEM